MFCEGYPCSHVLCEAKGGVADCKARPQFWSAVLSTRTVAMSSTDTTDYGFDLEHQSSDSKAGRSVRAVVVGALRAV
jgi:hypothetical protein